MRWKSDYQAEKILVISKTCSKTQILEFQVCKNDSIFQNYEWRIGSLQAVFCRLAIENERILYLCKTEKQQFNKKQKVDIRIIL